MRPSSPQLRQPSPVLRRSATPPLPTTSHQHNAEISENIRVAVRVRPKTSKESNVPVAVIVENEQEIVVSRQRFRFDQVFSETTNQEEIFQSMAAPLVESVCQGTNCALFAYGQTGTGKTFTMLGFDLWQLAAATSSSVQLDMLEKNEMRGVIPRAMKYLFSLLQGKPHKVSVSYLEIYNEKILDLLANASSMDNLELREDKNGAVQVIDATVKRVNSLAEVLEYLWKGAKNRAVSSTDMNEHSSRSHTIFQVTVEIKHSPDVTSKAKLNLIDLAGSEKWRPHLEFSDQRIAEMTSINQSLSNLGNCVRALLRPGKNHIPYRNSKLTRLVSDSLGGNAKTGFVVTVSPSELAHEETISTLQFADRAKKVVVRNEANYIESSEAAMKRLEQELQRQVRENQELREQLLQQARHPSSAAPVSSVPPPAPAPPPLMAAVPAAPDTIPQALSKALAAGGGKSKMESSSQLLSKPEEFLQDYHEHLRNRTSDGLTPLERLALLEWSVTLQSEELKRSIQEKREAVEKAIQLEQELVKAREEARSAESQRKQLELEVMEWKRKAEDTGVKQVSSSTQLQDLQRQVQELQRTLAQQSSAPATATPQQQHYKRPLADNINGANRITPKREDFIVKAGGMVGGSLGRTPSRENDYPLFTTTQAKILETPPPAQQQRTFHSSRATPRMATPNATMGGGGVGLQQQPPQVWDRFVDEATGRAYYHCKGTGQTTWKRPADSISQTIIVRGE